MEAVALRRRCGPAFVWDFAAACRTMMPLVEFTTKALGLKF
jgi:hypothetical protein